MKKYLHLIRPRSVINVLEQYSYIDNFSHIFIKLLYRIIILTMYSQASIGTPTLIFPCAEQDLINSTPPDPHYIEYTKRFQ